ncbi:MAG: transcription-repair coupling factor [Candidatus Brocadiia bacterium]
MPLSSAVTLLDKHKIIRLGQLWGSSASYAVSSIYAQRAGPLLVITHSPQEAETAFCDIETFLSLDKKASPAQAFLFPAPDTPDRLGRQMFVAEMLRVLRQVSLAHNPIIVCPVQSLIRNCPAPADFAKNTAVIGNHQHLPLEEFILRLTENGFNRQNEIEGPGEFSVRGGIMDIFPYDLPLPLRVEWLGNYVETIRQFDPATQETLQLLKQAAFALIKTELLSSGNFDPTGPTLFDHLPKNTLIALKEPSYIEEALAVYLLDYNNWLSDKLKAHPQAHLCTLPVGEQPFELNANIRSLERLSSKLANVISELHILSRQGVKINIFCADQAQKSMVATKLTKPIKLAAHFGAVSQGFYSVDDKATFINYREIFPEAGDEPSQMEAILTGYADLREGDFVVHFLHGIGRYRGVKKIRANDRVEEQMAIEYQDKAMLYVPKDQLGMVHRYIGSSGFGKAAPEIEKLGSRRWELKKEKARNAVARMAIELLNIQAAREKESGIAYPPDSELQTSFEATFPYRDTPDQVTITKEVKKDMEKRRPMDRLICGDVGYGKTEIALRAAFKAASHNKQVAFLAPTTILAQQHYQNFKARLADYPVTVDVLSRFKSKEQQRQAARLLAEGKIDIIIGTHRLLQPDVKFKDLGLVVIDEEHRFGVTDKEHFKRLRATVDVLTLTATPIPRTLNMALSGLRDISTLTTPPAGRHPIETVVCRFEPGTVKKAITRELSRDGQVFFVHNRVADIERLADKIRAIVPEVKIAIAHGQLAPHDLESRMRQFLENRANVLVCTNIIGSGLDIQRANTILVNNAHDFGLSDLHQLRGRVGRYREQAFAYFLIPAEQVIASDAVKRLKAIEEFSELGAGFKIALRDMEIRGIGNILGKEQHGYISAIGYQLYIQLLEQAVKKYNKRK